MKNHQSNNLNMRRGQAMVKYVAGCTCVNWKPTDIYSSFSILTTTFYITTAEAYSYKNSCQCLRLMYTLCCNLQKNAVKLTKYVQKTVCMPVTFLAQSSSKDAVSRWRSITPQPNEKISSMQPPGRPGEAHTVYQRSKLHTWFVENRIWTRKQRLQKYSRKSFLHFS